MSSSYINWLTASSFCLLDLMKVENQTMTSTSPSLTVTKVNDVDNDFHMETWINTGLYAQTWKAIAAKGDHACYDWAVKVDADAVFFPEKLARICIVYNWTVKVDADCVLANPLVDRIKLLPAVPTGAFVAKLVEPDKVDANAVTLA